MQNKKADSLPIVFTKSQYDEYYRDSQVRSVYREELMQISGIISQNEEYRILIKGDAGSGKTTLLKSLGFYNPYRTDIEFIHGYEFPINDGGIFNGDVIVIDGLDEVMDKVALHHILQNRKHKKLICTTRSGVDVDDLFEHIITLKPLSMEQMLELITQLLGVSPLFSEQKLHTILDKVRSSTPLEVTQSLIANSNNESRDNHLLACLNFLYNYKQAVEYSSGLIIPDKRIITPSREIVRGITVVNDSLLKEVKRKPEAMYSLTSRQFEEMVCELLDKQGYTVKLTKQTRDGGKDIIVVQNSMLGEFCIYIECKKFDQSNPVGVGLIRQLYGTVMAEKATAGLFVTTSYYTKDAKEFTETIRHQMSLKDYNDLVQELNKIKI